jgi:solute:Na+ symporter, SSS family
MTVFACVMNDVIAALTVAYDFLVGGLLAPLLGAMLWRGGTSAGALTSIAVGGTLVAVLLAWAGLDSDAPIYVGLAGSAVSFILVSLLTRAKR